MSVILTLSLCLTTSAMAINILRRLFALLLLLALVNAQYRRQPSYEPQQDGQYQQDVQYQQSYQQPQQQPQQQAYTQPQPAYQSAAPLPAILSHKQGLTSDGAFNYNFAADNGLQQGESINPDGSRTGSYSYVDPNGKTISVKYSAGKDGFRILEGDHLPKAPAPAAPAAPQQQYQGGSPAGSQYQSPVGYRSPQYQSPAAYSSPQYQSPAEYSSGGSQYQSAAPVRYTSGFGGSRGAGHASTQALFRPQQPAAQYRVQEQYSDDRAAQSYDDGSEQPAQYSQGAGQQQQRQEPHNFGSGYSFEFAG